ncbi:glycosyltransferase [Rhodococcus sp. MEB064]|uniref:glycosyltransferase n=1 Tax=Rhodococcus sp. MEB064 TaxID=1587522 RepID=UPI00069808C2|nr:glycosyltransferase [Rhodococcus sp. MEB064]
MVLTQKLKLNHTDVVVFSGMPAGADRSRNDLVHGFPLIHLRQIEIPLAAKRILIRIPRTKLLLSDLIVIEHAVKNLESYLLICWATLTGRKIALWGHGMTITQPASRLSIALQRWMLRHASWYFAYTEGSATRATSNGIDQEKCTVLNNTIDAMPLVRLRDCVKQDASGTWRALYVGGLDGAKRIDFLLDCCRRIYEINSHFRLIVKGDGQMRTMVEQAALEPWLEYNGAGALHGDPESVTGVKAILMPGRVGLVAIDSFALGIPIITTAWPWHAPEYEYLDESNSITTDDDEPAFIRAVVDLINNPKRQEKLAESCRGSNDRYSVESMADNFQAGVYKVLTTRDGGDQ